MTTPFNLRVNNVFLSHSSQDKLDFVDGLYQWLTSKAGLRVWYDRNLASGQVSDNLDQAIDASQAAVIVLSEHSIQSRWVALECSRLEKELADDRADFRIATIRLDNVDPPGLLKSFKHIDMTDGIISPTAVALLMDTLFGGKDSDAGRAIYVSRGSRQVEQSQAAPICRALQASGLRLVCDWIGQRHFEIDRIRNLIESSSGLLAILPHRGNGQTTSYILKEMDLAKEANIPILAFVHQDVTILPEWSFSEPQVFASDIDKHDAREVLDLYGNRIEEFVQVLGKPPRGEHIFLGHSLEKSIDDKFLTARGMLSRIAGLPVRVGGLVAGQEAQSEIVKLIGEAELCIIDITNLTYENLPEKINFALNSCIEAGIALGSGKDLYLTCRGQRRTPPFMFRNKQVWFYDDDQSLIGSLRQIAALHRRVLL